MPVYQDTLQSFFRTRTLVEVRFHDSKGFFKVAQILHSTKTHLTLVELTEKGQLDGICMYPQEKVASIKMSTSYLRKVEKKLGDNTIFNQALKKTQFIEDFTFLGFVKALKGQDIFVEISYEDGSTFAAKIIDFDSETLIADEYDEKSLKVTAHSVFRFSSIERLSLDVPWFRPLLSK